MATPTAAHRRPTSPLLTPGQKVAVLLAAAVTVLFAIAFKYGTTDRDPFADAAAAAGGTWAVATSLYTWVAAALAVPAYRTLRNIVTAPKGLHRA